MSKNSAQEAADNAFASALAATGARDPREFYRERLRELKSSDESAYDEAVRYYQDSLIPDVGGGAVDPVQAWLAYGCRLAELVTAGTPVTVDPSGLRRPLETPVPLDHLILHIPAKSGRALVVGLPKELSAAQRATFELLVRGRLKLRPRQEAGT